MADEKGFKLAAAYLEVSGDTSDADASIDALRKRLDDLATKVTQVKLDADTSAIDAKIADLRAKLSDLGASTASPSVQLDDSRIVAALEDIRAKLDELDGSVVDIRLTLEDADVGARLDDVKFKLDDLAGTDAHARLTLDDSAFNRQLDEDMAKLKAAGDASSSASMGGGGMPGGIIGPAILGGTSLIPALPGALTGAASAVGVLGLAFEGISPVLQDYSAKQSAAATAAAQGGAASTAAAQQIAAAQQAVSDADTQQAHDAITSAETIRNARQGVAQAYQQAAQSQLTAEQQLQSADYSEKQAQESLTAARAAAVLQLQQLNNAVQDTALGAAQAKLNVQEAQANQAAVDASSTSTALQRQQAALSVQEAEQALKEALQGRTNASKAANKADKDGVAGNPGVVAAKHNLADAEKAQANAARNLAQVETAGARSIAQAQQQLADAERAASWQRAADTERVATAQRNLGYAQATTAAGSKAAATAAGVYAAALSKLTPAGQGAVKQIEGLLGQAKKLEKISITALAPGIGGFLKGFKGLLPEIGTEVKQMGGIISKGLSDAGKLMETSGFKKTLRELFTEGNNFISMMGPAISKFMGAFAKMGAASAPALNGITKAITFILGGFDKLFSTLSKYAKPIGEFWSSLGQIIGDLGPLLGTLVGSLAQVLAPLLTGLQPLIKVMVNGLDTVMKALAPVLVQVVNALLGLVPMLVPLVPAMAQLVVQFIKLFDQAITPLLPVLPQLIGQGVLMMSAFVGPLTNLLIALNPLVQQLAPYLTAVAGAVVIASGVLQAMYGVIGTVINWVAKLITWLGKLTGWLNDNVPKAFKAVSDFLKSWWGQVSANFTKYIGIIESSLSTGWTRMKNDAIGIFTSIATWIGHTFGTDLKNSFIALVQDIGKIWQGLENILAGPEAFMMHKVYDPIATIVDDVTSFLGLGKPLPHMAEGGIVPGSGTGDTTPAMLTPGERVLSVPQVAKLGGHDAIDSMVGQAHPQVKGGVVYASGGFGWNPIKDIGTGLGDIGHLVGRLVRGAVTDTAKPLLEKALKPVAAIAGTAGGWGKAMAAVPAKMVSGVLGWMSGQDAKDGSGGSASVGSGSGSQVAKYAAGYGTGKGHPYVTGGSTPSGWDCSGFAAWVYEHFGYFPGSQGQRYGTSESQYASSLLQPSGAVPGALVFFDDNFYPNPGHVGVVLNSSSYVGADSPEVGTAIHGLGGAVGFRVPKGGFAPVGGTSGAAQQYAKAQLGKHGWGAAQWNPLKSLWQGESGWRWNAANASGAYGIPQALPGSKMASAGKDWKTNQQTQINWGEGYIKDRYGSPSVAYKDWLARSPHWYAGGTPGALPGWAWVGERGPELVKMHGGETVIDHARSMAVAPLGLGGYASGTPVRAGSSSIDAEITAARKKVAADKKLAAQLTAAGNIDGLSAKEKKQIFVQLTAAIAGEIKAQAHVDSLVKQRKELEAQRTKLQDEDKKTESQITAVKALEHMKGTSASDKSHLETVLHRLTTLLAAHKAAIAEITKRISGATGGKGKPPTDPTDPTDPGTDGGSTDSSSAPTTQPAPVSGEFVITSTGAGQAGGIASTLPGMGLPGLSGSGALASYLAAFSSSKAMQGGYGGTGLPSGTPSFPVGGGGFMQPQAAGRGGVTVNNHYHGTSHPTPEQQAAMNFNLGVQLGQL